MGGGKQNNHNTTPGSTPPREIYLEEIDSLFGGQTFHHLDVLGYCEERARAKGVRRQEECKREGIMLGSGANRGRENETEGVRGRKEGHWRGRKHEKSERRRRD